MQLAVFDLDDTVVNGDTFIRFLIACLRAYPLRVFRCLHLPFAVAMHLAGMRDNTWLKITFLRAIVGGLTRHQIVSITTPYVAQTLTKCVKTAAVETMAQHREAGRTLILASASPDLYVHEIGKQLGFDQVVATRVAFRRNASDANEQIDEDTVHNDDVCTGNLIGNNCYGAHKVSILKTAVSNNVDDYIAAYSDHHSDLPLLQLAKKGYAVDPSDKLRALASEHDLEILEWA